MYENYGYPGKDGRHTVNSKLRHNTGVHPGYFMRTIIEVDTDEGITGLGEVGGGDQRGAIAKIKDRAIGLDPFHLEEIKLRAVRSIYYSRTPEYTEPSSLRAWISRARS